MANDDDVFRAKCIAAAARWRASKKHISLLDVVDLLQNYAVAYGLVAELGQDSVQRIIFEAFREVR